MYDISVSTRVRNLVFPDNAMRIVLKLIGEKINRIAHAQTSKGVERRAVAKGDLKIATGINIIDGKITYKGVAEAFDFPYYSLDAVIA